MSEVLENIKTRRSVRKFKDTQIAKEALEDIITAGLYAPSAKNTQNWQLTIVQGHEKLSKLSAAIGQAIGNPNYHQFYKAPTLIIVSTPRDYEHGRSDSAAVLENIFLEANALRIGSVWINQLVGISDVQGVREILREFNIPDDHIVWGSAAIGYSDGEIKSDRENKGKVVYA
jgi:nitroreductase